jgi:hypothetical protein
LIISFSLLLIIISVRPFFKKLNFLEAYEEDLSTYNSRYYSTYHYDWQISSMHTMYPDVDLTPYSSNPIYQINNNTCEVSSSSGDWGGGISSGGVGGSW